MGEVFGQLLPIAVGIAISPLPIVAVVLMLATPRGRVNGPAFVLAWIVGLAVVGTIVIAGRGRQRPERFRSAFGRGQLAEAGDRRRR